jgi:CBS domain-containing protein
VKVRDLMSTDVVVVRPDAGVRDVAALLRDRGVSGVPVVDDDGHVLGVVSQADILARIAGPAATRLIGSILLDVERIEPKRTARTAGEAMSAPASVIQEDCPLGEAAERMVRDGVKRLPVVRAGKLVGIVTRSDLMRAFLRSDEEIADDVRESVLRTFLGLSAGEASVHVQDGVVAIRGHVETRSEAETVKSLVLRVPGVVDVEVSLRWRIDDRTTPRRSSPTTG